MKHFKLQKLIFTTLILGCAFAQSVFGAGKSTAAFLKIPVSAEVMALGGNTIVLGSGLGGAVLNPAVLAGLDQHEFQASYGMHLEGYQTFNAAYGHSGSFMNTGLSVVRIAATGFEGRDNTGATTGGFSASDMAVNFSAAKNFDQLALGANLKYINSAIEKESASAVALDAGAVLKGELPNDYGFKLGASVRNLGTGMKYINKTESLPVIAAAGFAVTFAKSFEAGLNISNNVIDNITEVGAGAVVNLGDILSLTGGIGKELGQTAVPFKLSAGVRFQVSDIVLSYGFAPMGELGNSQRMTVSLKFGGKTGTFNKKSRKANSNWWKI